jgi:hypothetical protein
MKVHVFALILAVSILGSCDGKVEAPVEEAVSLEAGPCTNGCKDYSVMWMDKCPDGERCLTFVNNCDYDVGMAYQVGCNADGSKGAPQCDCTTLPNLKAGATIYWQIVDGNWTTCDPWQPDCLTAGFEVMLHKDDPNCTDGTRIEFSAGNQGNVYSHFDSYNIDVELGFSVPAKFAPDLTCANDHANHDCRPLWCGDEKCPDAYANPTQGGCPDGRSPQGGCQDTFGNFGTASGYAIEMCPKDCPDGKCPSCQEAKPCN